MCVFLVLALNVFPFNSTVFFPLQDTSSAAVRLLESVAAQQSYANEGTESLVFPLLKNPLTAL